MCLNFISKGVCFLKIIIAKYLEQLCTSTKEECYSPQIQNLVDKNGHTFTYSTLLYFEVKCFSKCFILWKAAVGIKPKVFRSGTKKKKFNLILCSKVNRGRYLKITVRIDCVV